MATEEPASEAPNLPLVKPAGITQHEIWLLCERYGVEFTPPSARDMQLFGTIKALEEMVDMLGHRPKTT